MGWWWDVWMDGLGDARMNGHSISSMHRVKNILLLPPRGPWRGIRFEVDVVGVVVVVVVTYASQHM